MDAKTLIKIEFKVDPQNAKDVNVSVEAKEGITVAYVIESMANFVKQLLPIYESTPNMPFSGFESNKK